MRGRKKASPKIRELVEGKLRVVADAGEGAEPERLYPSPPVWITDPNGRALWSRLIPDLIRRKKYLHLFECELGRYCVHFGLYVGSLKSMRLKGGTLDPVKKSSKGVEMLRQDWVVANRADANMSRIAADLGLNAVAYQRIETLQLDLFGEPADGASSSPAPPGTSFGAFRRGQ